METVDEATTRVTEDIDGVYDQTVAGRREVDSGVEPFETIDHSNDSRSTSAEDVATATDQQAERTEGLALVAEEARRKANRILEETNEIDQTNRALLEKLESTLDRET
ncbi:MAG: hypothetical protein V5A24_05650 [Haloarculaceae archaeon]